MNESLPERDSGVSVMADELLEMYRCMLQIRRFEETTSTLYAAGEIPGFVHVSNRPGGDGSRRVLGPARGRPHLL
jgi:TPP-dependent pyruvate/acetoin dehydrogenase alpha subunit